jgi:phosphoglycolate phosphatase-like HAD superfamily hydrolase
MRNIYFDFDGTIVDSSSRLYEVYKSIMAELRRPCLGREEYWNLKRERQSYEFILNKTASGELAPEYMRRFLERVESMDFIKFDKLINGALHTLSKLKVDNRLVLVTLRRSRDNLYQELKDLEIFDFFKGIFVNFKEDANSWETVATTIKSDAKFSKENSLVVGDTEDTVLAGKILGIPSFLVLSGIRSESFLKKYNPSFMLNDINELFRYLPELGLSNR